MDGGAGRCAVELCGSSHRAVSDSALALEAIDKRFGEVQALRGASLNVRRGTLHAVLGENGAGKTTLMRIAFGLMPADTGGVHIDGAPVTLTSVADDVTVLRRGQCVLTASSAQLDMTALVRAVTGDDSGEPFSKPDNATAASTSSARRVPQRGACVAHLDAVSAHDARGVERVRDATVDCFAGEIIGLAGVEGSGVHELLRLLAGRMAPSSGVATLPPRIGFIPEDRVRDAVIEEFTLTENVALRGAGARRGRMPWPAIAALTAGLMERHDVRAPSPATRAGALSGGNQQKFVVGRELDEHPALVVAENPVRGLDIRATAHVLRELAGSATAGSAVVFYSADIDELLPIADRMLVVFAGRVREVAVERAAVANALVGAT